MLRNKTVDINIIEYLKNPPSASNIRMIAEKLNLNPKEFLRKSDKKYKELSLSEFSGSDSELFQLMSENPSIIERPIIISNNKAVIGRPPENILKLF